MPDDDLLRVLLIGDFSGRSSAPRDGLRPLERRPAPRVDRDDFERRMADTDVRVSLAGGAEPVPFGSLDDFEPDVLAERVPELRELAAMRAAAADPEALSDLHRRLVGDDSKGSAPIDETPESAGASGGGTDPAGGGLLDAALEATEARGSDGPTGIGIVDAAIADAMRGHRLPARDPRRDQVEDALDRAREAALRRLLKDPGLRRVESAWRAVERLVFGLDSDRGAAVHILDATAGELLQDLAGAAAVEDSAAWRRLVDGSVGSPGAARWTAIVLLHRFGHTAAEAALLARLAKLTTAAEATLFADVGPDAVGATAWDRLDDPGPTSDARDEQAWKALRGLPQAARVALVAPGPLDRLPFGPRGRTCDLPGFDELPDRATAVDLAWGFAAPVAAMACLSAAAGRDGFRPVGTARLGGLPSVLLDGPDGPDAAPAAEAWLDDRQAARLGEAGLTPLRPIRGEPALLIGPLRSIRADDPELAWG